MGLLSLWYPTGAGCTAAEGGMAWYLREEEWFALKGFKEGFSWSLCFLSIPV